MHWLGAVTSSHVAAAGAAVVVAAAVVAGEVVGASIGGGDVAGASLDNDAVLAGDVEELDDVSEHAASTPSNANAMAVARLTWRLRHRVTLEGW
jgi:hypothetical protein